METVLAVLRSSEDPGQQALQPSLAVKLLLCVGMGTPARTPTNTGCP